MVGSSSTALANKIELICLSTPQANYTQLCACYFKAAGCQSKAGRKLRTCDVIGNRALGEAD